MFKIWAGVDIGKEHHHCVALDARGERRLSRRVGNEEPELLELIRDVLALADPGEMLWAVDTNHGSAALLIGPLLDQRQPMVYLTGLTVRRAAAGYRGQRSWATPTSTTARSACQPRQLRAWTRALTGNRRAHSTP